MGNHAAHRRTRAVLATFLKLAAVGSVIGILLLQQAFAGELEAKVKVAYIYNFIKFIEWPGEDGLGSSEPINICIIGNDPIRTMLGELSNREVKGRPLKINRIKELNTLTPCHLLFISRSEEQQLPLILQRAQGARVLTVSDIPQFAHRGGMIGFSVEKERVKIEVNQRTTRQAGLKVSAKLLEAARIVQ